MATTPRFEIPDVRGETRDVAIPASSVDLAALTALATGADTKATTALAGMPSPATAAPKAEATTPAVGSDPKVYSLDGHQHPRLTSTTASSVSSGNTAAISFTRAFTNEPGIVYQELPPTPNTTTPDAGDTAAAAQPTQAKVIAWTKGPTAALPDAPAGSYTGCMVRVWKAQTVPQNLATLLLGGVFNLFAASVVGTRFSIIAVARSDVA